MSDELTKRGWLRLPYDGNPRPGDILLNDANHVGMWLGDGLAQASIDENGDIAGGAPGDQTGAEVHIRPLYDYPWDCILRWPYRLEDDVAAKDVWEYNYEDSAPGGNTYNALCFEIPGQLAALRVQVEALGAAIETLAKANGADPEKVSAAVADAVRDKLSKIKLTVTE
jgi:hypothetical protein